MSERANRPEGRTQAGVAVQQASPREVGGGRYALNVVDEEDQVVGGVPKSLRQQKERPDRKDGCAGCNYEERLDDAHSRYAGVLCEPTEPVQLDRYQQLPCRGNDRERRKVRSERGRHQAVNEHKNAVDEGEPIEPAEANLAPVAGQQGQEQGRSPEILDQKDRLGSLDRQMQVLP